MRQFVGSMVLLAVASLLAVSCGGDDDEADANSDDTNGLGVALKNWSVEPSTKILKAGLITVTATHEEAGQGAHGGSEGGATHQLVIARLETGKSGEGQFGKPLLNLADIKPGDSKSGQVELTAGTYELACLVLEDVNGKSVDHYQEGMHTTVTVQ